LPHPQAKPHPIYFSPEPRRRGRRRLGSRRAEGMGEFDDYWARAYRGDSGVPHSDPQRLVSTWTGAFALGAAACVHHHASALASHIKNLPATWQDVTLVLDQKRWKKILEKKQQQA
ncbi:unnamed protein product, partial [Urochloa humidicola]